MFANSNFITQQPQATTIFLDTIKPTCSFENLTGLNNPVLQQTEENEDMCRICFEGKSAGRLISPCTCRGSSKYVHSACLDQWRKTSQKQESYYQCDTCQYRYLLGRARWEKRLTNKGKLKPMLIHVSSKT